MASTGSAASGRVPAIVQLAEERQASRVRSRLTTADLPR